MRAQSSRYKNFYTYGTCKYRSPADCTDNNKRRGHNCRYAKKSVKSIMWYLTTTRTSRGCSTFFVTNNGIHTTTRNSISKRSSCTNKNSPICATSRAYWWTPFCPTVGAYRKRPLRVSLCSLATGFMWARIILMLFAKVGISSSVNGYCTTATGCQSNCS